MVKTYRVRRGFLKVGDARRGPGELIPEAHTWLRVDNWVHEGTLTDAEVSEDEFRAAIAQYCPDQLDRILELAGVPDDVDLTGPRKTPRKRAPRKPRQRPGPRTGKPQPLKKTAANTGG